MTKSNVSVCVTFFDIIDAELMPDGYMCPPEVRSLPAQVRKALFDDPLTPVAQHDGLRWRAQRALLHSLSCEALNDDLRMCARCIYVLSSQAWAYVAQTGRPNYLKLPNEVRTQKLSKADAADIAQALKHWNALLWYAKPQRELQP